MFWQVVYKLKQNTSWLTGKTGTKVTPTGIHMQRNILVWKILHKWTQTYLNSDLLCVRFSFVSQIRSSRQNVICKWSDWICVPRHHQPICMGCNLMVVFLVFQCESNEIRRSITSSLSADNLFQHLSMECCSLCCTALLVATWILLRRSDARHSGFEVVIVCHDTEVPVVCPDICRNLSRIAVQTTSKCGLNRTCKIHISWLFFFCCPYFPKLIWICKKKKSRFRLVVWTNYFAD